MNPRNGQLASVTNPTDWGTFNEVTARVEAGQAAGVGFVLTESDPFAFIDLDVNDGQQPSAEQQEILKRFEGYAETSLSGRGLHIVVRGAVPSGRRRGNVEVYSSGRYMTMTGNIFRPGAILDQNAKLGELWTQLGSGNHTEVTGAALSDPNPAPGVVDERLVELICGAASNADHYNGHGIHDWSASYFALICAACLFSSDEAQVRRVVMASPLVQKSPPAANGESRPHKAQRLWPSEYRRAASKGALERQQQAQSAAHGATLANSIAPKPSVPTSSSLIIRPMSEVKMCSIEYLWKGWVPVGYLTLVAGETGASKTTAVADISAKVSNGQPFPGELEGRAPAKVLWLGSEDGIEDMTVPRLKANGANLTNIIEVRGVNRNGVRGTFSMQDDIAAVSELLKGGILRNDPFKLIVIDPVTSYLTGSKQREVKIGDAGQLRAVLEPWMIVAQEYKISLIGITHFMKDTNRSMLHRVLGSAAFGETCRSLIAFVDRSSDQQPFAKSMIQVKTNLPEHPGGAWLFETEKVEVGTDENNGKAIFATRPVWDRLDALVGIENSTAKSGAYSDTSVSFAIWITDFFANVPSDQGIEVSRIKAAAIGWNVVSEKQWERLSPAYLEKKNINGVWQCRPRQK